MPTMVTAEPDVARWKSEKAANKFAALYEAMRTDTWADLHQRGLQPLPELLHVPSAFGTTAVFHWPGRGSPVVLLHGQGSTSIMWSGLLEHLSGRDVYALEQIGDPGLSVQTKAIRDAEEIVAWLHEALDGLNLQRVHLVGASFGGWVASHYAALHPGRLLSLALLEPAIAPLDLKRFIRHGMAVGATILMPPPFRRRVARRLDAEALLFGDKRLKRLGLLTMRLHERGLPRLGKIADHTPDAVLGAISVPTLALFGQRSELHDSDQAAARTRRLIQHSHVRVVPGASHALPVTKIEVVGPAVSGFLKAHDALGEPSETP